MKKITFSLLIAGLLILCSRLCQAQGSDCNLCYECEWVYNSKGQKVLFSALDRADGLSGEFGAKENHTKTGSYEQECLKKMKNLSKKQETEQAKIEASKEKTKNGETVASWYSSGKAKSSIQEPVTAHSNVTFYYENGQVDYKYKDNVIYLYKDGKFSWKGPGITERDAWGNVDFYMHGVWKNKDGDLFVFDHDKDVSDDFIKKLKRVKTLEALTELNKEYPYQEIKNLIEEKKKTIIAMQEYYEKLDQTLRNASLENFQKFQKQYPDSSKVVTSLIQVLNGSNYTVEINIVVILMLDIKAINTILFKSIDDNTREYFNNYASVTIKMLNGKIAMAKFYDDSKRLLVKVRYKDGVVSECEDHNARVRLYENGKFAYEIYNYRITNASDALIYKADLNRADEIITFYQKVDTATFNRFFTYLLDKYQSMNPEAFGYLNTLVQIQFKDNNIERAQQYSKRAIELLDSTPFKWYFECYIGLSYWKNGEMNKALEYFKPKMSREYVEKGRREYNGTGSTTYISDIKIKYFDVLDKNYRNLNSNRIAFPNEKENWKQLKALRK